MQDSSSLLLVSLHKFNKTNDQRKSQQTPLFLFGWQGREKSLVVEEVIQDRAMMAWADGVESEVGIWLELYARVRSSDAMLDSRA